MNEAVVWAVLIVGFVVPLAHVALSPRSGPFRPVPGARGPFGPRVGWLIIVLLAGPVGWLLYMLRRRRP